MASSFGITTAASSVPLSDQRSGQVAFTVSNTTARALRGRARIVAQDAVASPWLSLVGQAEREFPVAGTQQYIVQLTVPPTAPAGNYPFRLDMVGVDNPDEDLTQGPSVTFTVPAPVVIKKKPFPWWIIAAAAALLVVIIAAYFLLSNGQKNAAAEVSAKTATAAALLTAAANEGAAAAQTATAVAAANQTATAVAVANQTATEQANVANRTATALAAANQTATAQAALNNRVTTVQITYSPANSAARGQAVTLTAQVNTLDGKTATGSMTFAQDSNPMPGCPNPVALSSGKATCVTSGLALGTHSISASYSGDANHNPSVLRDHRYAITPANTSVSISADSGFNGIPTWRYSAGATVNNTSSGGALVPTGTVTFHFTDRAAVNRDLSCTLSNGSCSVSFTDGLLYYAVSAAYSPGSGDFNASSSPQVGTGR